MTYLIWEQMGAFGVTHDEIYDTEEEAYDAILVKVDEDIISNEGIEASSNEEYYELYLNNYAIVEAN